MTSDDWRYGVYVTFNIYTKLWYAFDRENATAYWTGEPCKKGSGKTAQQALNNYKNETNSTQ